MSQNYMHIDDCPGRGEIHEWTVETVDFDEACYGQGRMRQRRCTKCSTVEYLKFTGHTGQVIVVRNTDDTYCQGCRKHKITCNPGEDFCQGFKEKK